MNFHMLKGKGYYDQGWEWSVMVRGKVVHGESPWVQSYGKHELDESAWSQTEGSGFLEGERI